MDAKTVDFTRLKVASVSFWQYDYGQKLILVGPLIIAGIKVQWFYGNNAGTDHRLIEELDNALVVSIPNAALEQSLPVIGYIYASTEEFGNTIYTINIDIRERASLVDIDSEDIIPIIEEDDQLPISLEELEAAIEGINIKQADFTELKVENLSYWKYDYGQIIEFVGGDINEEMIVQWSYGDLTHSDSRPITKSEGKYYTRVPNNALRQDAIVFGYIYQFNQYSGNTLYSIQIVVRDRLDTDEEITQDELTAWQQLLIDTKAAKEAAEQIVVTVENYYKEAEDGRDTAYEERENDRDDLFEDAETIRNSWTDWLPGVTYLPFQKVQYNGSSYIAREENTGITPADNPLIWRLIVSKGDRGDLGNITITDKNFIFSQPTVSSVWTVSHSLGKYPSVTIIEGSNINDQTKEVHGTIQYLDVNRLQITFSNSIYGFAILN
ncbi:MAG: hypothetical protein WC967_15630 [Balneolaceae bacterium]